MHDLSEMVSQICYRICKIGGGEIRQRELSRLSDCREYSPLSTMISLRFDLVYLQPLKLMTEGLYHASRTRVGGFIAV